MAQSLFGNPKITTNIKFNEPVIANFLVTELKTFREFYAVDVLATAKLLAKQRLSEVVGPKYGSWHRPEEQPGRSGDYDKSFRVRTRLNNKSVTVVLYNTQPYSLYVESGTRSKGYRIAPRNSPFLYFFHHGGGAWVLTRKAVTHPGPWQSGTANSNGRQANPAYGEVEGFGAWIMSDAQRLSILSAARKTEISLAGKLAR